MSAGQEDVLPSGVKVVSRGYPGGHLVRLDPRFDSVVLRSAPLERLATGFAWAEGPVWFGDHRRLVFSDIPNDRLLSWDESTRCVSIFRSPSDFANGATRDGSGRLVTCEHGGRRVTRTAYDGRLEILADSYDGSRLNSPNDVITAPDGSIVFTDPRFGIGSDFQGTRANSELRSGIYRVSPSDDITLLSTEFEDPNGLALSPDGRLLYVVESTGAPGIYSLPVDAAGAVGPRSLVCAAVDGEFDGIRLDEAGRIWCAWSDLAGDEHGVRILAPDGVELGRIAVPEPCTNLTFGGRLRTRLFVTSVWSLYSITVGVRGLG